MRKYSCLLNYQWQFVPLMNPDGYHKSHKKDQTGKYISRWRIGLEMIYNNWPECRERIWDPDQAWVILQRTKIFIVMKRVRHVSFKLRIATLAIVAVRQSVSDQLWQWSNTDLNISKTFLFATRCFSTLFISDCTGCRRLWRSGSEQELPVWLGTGSVGHLFADKVESYFRNQNIRGDVQWSLVTCLQRTQT